MEPWKNPSLSLGERCVLFAENELKNGVCEDKLNSFTSPRIREYLAPATRLINGKEVKLNLNNGNWCQASVCFSMINCLLPGEIPPHAYRVGVIEVISEMIHNGTHHSIKEVRNKQYQIKIGDLIFFDRSRPNDPKTAWYRHVGRVYSVKANGDFQCISGNAGGKWKISDHKLTQTTLLGFGEYPKLATESKINPSPPLPLPFKDQDLNPAEDTGTGIAFTSIFDKIKNIFK